jgi:hypothetical protein
MSRTAERSLMKVDVGLRLKFVDTFQRWMKSDNNKEYFTEAPEWDSARRNDWVETSRQPWLPLLLLLQLLKVKGQIKVSVKEEQARLRHVYSWWKAMPFIRKLKTLNT